MKFTFVQSFQHKNIMMRLNVRDRLPKNYVFYPSFGNILSMIAY